MCRINLIDLESREGEEMKLFELVEGIDCEIRGSADIDVQGVEFDSRRVYSGCLFFCISGLSTDGHKFAPDAVAAGASVLVVTRWLELDVTQVLVKDDRAAMALISAAFYGHPAKKLRMVGVTGTNGKTSTTYFLKRIFENGGSKVGLIGTIQNMIGDEVLHTERTTPESVELQALLAQMLEKGVDTVVMEVSSHSLALKRVYGIEFDGAIFTNLTQDHLDFHGDFEHYAAAKKILFENCKCAAFNADDEYCDYMRSDCANSVTFGVNSGDIRARDIALGTTGSRFVLAMGGVRLPLFVKIPGMFSVYNALGTVALCSEMGIDMLDVKQGLESVENIPGRFETLDTRGEPFSVVLDYAHTPDSLEGALKAAREFSKGRVVCVFGCGGNRDNTKRPIMGEISGRLADFSIVTSDNPRFEEPEEIIAQILPGMDKVNGKHITIENRRDAIKYALEHAQKNDVILLAGKGHEDYQEICGVKHDFDEKVIVAELLDELGIKSK